MSEGKVFELPGLLSRLAKEGGYFLDFLKVRNLEAGVIVLHPNETDTQEPHSDDELYFVIRGEGWVQMGKKKIRVEEGSIIFIPAGMEHKFYGNDVNLVVLYVFAAKE